jgi:serine phosphatase RsbU (regulator of sigma subunit)
MAFALTGTGTLTGPFGPAPCPADLTKLEGLDLVARYHAARRGGDFFDVLAIGQRVIFLLMDISGTRAEAQALAVDVQTAFHRCTPDLFAPSGANESEAISTLGHELNSSLIEAARGVRFAPAFLGCFSIPMGILTHHNAGLFAVFQDSEGARTLQSGGIPLGLFTHITYEPEILAFNPRARLLLVTKGVTEIRRGASEFGAQRVEWLFANVKTDSASQICDTVLQQAYAFGNQPWTRIYDLLHHGKHGINDDLTAVALVRD